MTGLQGHDRIPDLTVVTRFVFFRNHVRSDGTVKGDAFMPPSNLQLSVTLISDQLEPIVWGRGAAVAAVRKQALVGRADCVVNAIRSLDNAGLDIVSDPIPEDPMHAIVVGWPPLAEKSRQKHIAQTIAAAARFFMVPHHA